MISGNVNEWVIVDWPLLVTIDYNAYYQIVWVRGNSESQVCAVRHRYGTGWGNGAVCPSIRHCNHRINREIAYIISNIIISQSAAYRSTRYDVIYSRYGHRVCSGARESHIGNRVSVHQADDSKLGPGKGHRVTIGLTAAVSCNRKRFGCDTCCQSSRLGERVVTRLGATEG